MFAINLLVPVGPVFAWNADCELSPAIRLICCLNFTLMFLISVTVKLLVSFKGYGCHPNLVG